MDYFCLMCIIEVLIDYENKILTTEKYPEEEVSRSLKITRWLYLSITVGYLSYRSIWNILSNERRDHDSTEVKQDLGRVISTLAFTLMIKFTTSYNPREVALVFYHEFGVSFYFH